MDSSENSVKENPQSEVKAELFSPSTEAWEQVKTDILRLEQQAFPEHPYEEQELREGFLNPDTTAVVLRDISGRVVGFTYTVPIDKWYPKRQAEHNETVLVDDTVIAEEYKGKHFVGGMMAVLEDALRDKGYSYMERNAAIANNYAANIKKAYAERIVGEPERSDPKEDNQWGARMHFRIKL